MKVLCVLGENFEEGEALMPVDLLRRVGVTVDIAALKGHEMSGGHGIIIKDLMDLDEVDLRDYGMLFIPGGLHWPLLESDTRVRDAIELFINDPDRYVAAICAGPTILGRMGHLRGRRYTCFPPMNEDFGGTYVDEYAVTDGHLITGKSVAASIDMGLAMVEAAAGSDVLKDVKERIFY